MAEKQTKMDSFLESVGNVLTGFIISWLVWVLIVDPLYGFNVSIAKSFGITCIFTVSSIVRSYVLRRLFNGRSVWHVVKAKFA